MPSMITHGIVMSSCYIKEYMEKKYLTVQEAASVLGIGIRKMQRWADAGKVPSIRHPLNNYRMFKRKDVEELLKKLAPFNE